MGMNREKATSRQMHISSPSSSSSESTNRGWGDFDRAMKKLEGQKRKVSYCCSKQAQHTSTLPCAAKVQSCSSVAVRCLWKNI